MNVDPIVLTISCPKGHSWMSDADLESNGFNSYQKWKTPVNEKSYSELTIFYIKQFRAFKCFILTSNVKSFNEDVYRRHLQVPWIQKISNLSQHEKEGFYRILIPPGLFHQFGLDPITFRDESGRKAVRFFSPRGDRTCLVEIKFQTMEEPLYSIQLSDTNDLTQLDWDFLIVNDPASSSYKTQTDQEGRDTLFGWASRNLSEEEKALEAGLFPGQVSKGMGLTRQVINLLEFFCQIFDIKSIRLEALFYHNAITYERNGFSYFSGFGMMKKIHELFQPGGVLFRRLDNSTPFRRPEFADTVRGRSWAIHDGILDELDDDLLCEGWVSPTMYRMVGKPRGMITFPDPIY